MTEHFDTIIIGGGPAGYVCAIRSAQLGMKVAIVDKRNTLGGTCLNVGCIPSKALLDSSENFLQAAHSFKDHGILIKDISFDLKAMMARKDKVVSEVCSGVDFLMKKNKISHFTGNASFLANNEIKINTENKDIILNGKNIVIATGSAPMPLPGLEIDGNTIITSNEAIALNKVPEHLIVIGGGVIGLELGSVWQRLGAKVTIIEMQDKLLGTADKQISSMAHRLLEAAGMKILLSHKYLGTKINDGTVTVQIEDKNGIKSELTGDKLLVAIGRVPFTENLGLENTGVKLNQRKRIEVDGKFRTSVNNIYAIGDVIEGPMLAHKAQEEGIALAENIAGLAGHVNYSAIPSIVYTWPEIAWVGKGEEELKEKGIEFKVGKSYFKANGRAKAMNEADGMVKILADKRTDKALGFYIIGPRASDMIAEAAIAFEFGAYAEDIARSVHAHPTLAETVKEAAMNVDNWSIHS